MARRTLARVIWQGASAYAAAGAGRGQPGDGLFGDQRAFELSQRGEDPENELARGRSGVSATRLKHGVPHCMHTKLLQRRESNDPE